MVFDNDPDDRAAMAASLERAGYGVQTAKGERKAIAGLGSGACDIVITALRAPTADGLALLTLLRMRHPRLPVLVVSEGDDVATAVEAMKRGASEYLVEPLDGGTLLETVSRSLGRVPPATGGPRSPLDDEAHRVAGSDAPLLVVGPAGSGRARFARTVHSTGPRRSERCVHVDLRVLPPDLFETTLFGHRRGAFSGAERDREGMLRAAGRGTVVLESIDGLSLAQQAKMLRVLQEREVLPVGATRALPIAARLCATAGDDLEERVARGDFREDLFYRLAVLVTRVPPLRDRLPELSSLFASVWPAGTPWPQFEREAWEAWGSHSWPGNMVELRAVAERAAAFSLRVIDAPTARRLLHVGTSPETIDLDRERHRAEVDVIRHAIRRAGGNKSEAARTLGISRGTLYNKLRELQG